MMTRIVCLALIALGPTFVQTAQAQESSVDKTIANHLKTLQTSNDAGALKAALQALNPLSRQPEAVKAVPVLIEFIRSDSLGEIRGLAIEVLGLIQRERGQPCPLVIVESRFGEDADVRNYAAVYAGIFDKFEPWAVDVLLRQLATEDPLEKGEVLIWLAIVEKHDAELLDLLRKHTKDSHFYVRHCAHWAVYNTTNKLEDIVPYCVVLTASAVEKPSLLSADASEDMKDRQTQRNLVTLSGTGKLMSLLTSDDDGFAALMKLRLQDNSPEVRRQTLIALEKAISMIAESSSTRWIPRFSLEHTEQLQPKKQKTALERLQGAFLRDVEIEDRVTRLRDMDPDEKVRIAAAGLLKTMVEVRQKKPSPPLNSIEYFLTPSDPNDARMPSGYGQPVDISEGVRDGTSNTIRVEDLLRQRGNKFNHKQWTDSLIP